MWCSSWAHFRTSSVPGGYECFSRFTSDVKTYFYADDSSFLATGSVLLDEFSLYMMTNVIHNTETYWFIVNSLTWIVIKHILFKPDSNVHANRDVKFLDLIVDQQATAHVELPCGWTCYEIVSCSLFYFKGWLIMCPKIIFCLPI